MDRILAQCIKELAQFRRDRLGAALVFLLPLMTMLIFVHDNIMFLKE